MSRVEVMAFVDKKKIGALVDKNAEKKAPPKKPGGSFPPKGAKPGGGGDGGPPGGDDQGDDDKNKKKKKKGGGGQSDEQIAQQQAARVANGNADEELAEFADDVDMESDDAPSFALDEDVWERAKTAVRGLDDAPAPDDEAVVMIHVYDALGGEVAGAGDDDDDDADDDDAPKSNAEPDEDDFGGDDA